VILETLWFILLSFLLIGYTVLDGFDLGVGILFPFVAKTEKERRLVLQAIGPLWDGNEVWLVAAGGVLFFAFPRAYASALSGLYLAIFLVLWLIILRALAIELHVQVDNPLWRTFWEAIFFIASLGLALTLGAALGNLLRGFPLDADGHFFLPLWTDLLPGVPTGVLDVYTLPVGIFAVIILALHGANFLVWKTGGELQQRARSFAAPLTWVSGFLALLILVLTPPLIQPQVKARFLSQPWGFIFPVFAVTAWGLLLASTKRNHSEILPLAFSKLLIASLLATASFGIFPHLLISLGAPANSLTIFNATTSQYGLSVGLVWFTLGLLLLLTYTGYVYKVFWGKVTLSVDEGY
jgi:cytochrome d ubiquinol oxidase subunit II